MSRHRSSRRRGRLLLAVVGVGLEVLVVLLTQPASAPPWRVAVSIVFASVGLFTFAVVALTALRDNAHASPMITTSRPHYDPFATDWHRPRSTR